MSYLKTEKTAPARSALNTTINTAIFDAFKQKCRDTCVPMNILLESFMDAYNQDKVRLKLSGSVTVKTNDEKIRQAIMQSNANINLNEDIISDIGEVRNEDFDNE